MSVNPAILQRIMLPSGHFIVTDFKRGIALLCDPEDGRCQCCGKIKNHWNLTFSFQVAGTDGMMRPGMRIQNGMN
jgi:hypothetical protein